MIFSPAELSNPPAGVRGERERSVHRTGHGLAWRGAMRRLLICMALACIGPGAATADDDIPPADQGGGKRTVYKTSRFVLHCDLPRHEGEQMLQRMDASLDYAEKYWRRPTRGRIVCYVIGDLKNWPDSALPHSLARVWIGGIGGATILEAGGSGNASRSRTTVYAAPRPGIIEHEIVHAYCCQTFGATGPDWYKEGMAEDAMLEARNLAGGPYTPELIRALRAVDQRAVGDIVGGEDFTRDISASLQAMLNNRRNAARHVPMSDWTQEDTNGVERARATYLWSWALCHMLVNNPNYADRFRALGSSYLTNRRDSFEQAFAPVGHQVNFEYEFFMRHLDVGYRVDLCHWDWSKRFRELAAGQTLNGQIAAARGFQPTGLSVIIGQRYRYRVTGNWSTSAELTATDANGDKAGRGRLVGVLMRDYRLSEPFELGTDGMFRAGSSGELYLRCRDSFNELVDNTGSVNFEFAHNEAGLH